jgi:hypothetical protein
MNEEADFVFAKIFPADGDNTCKNLNVVAGDEHIYVRDDDDCRLR